MPRKKEHKITLNQVKHSTSMKKYAWIREHGFTLVENGEPSVTLKGADLDAYIDEAIWRAAHPGQEPVLHLNHKLEIIG